MTTGRSRKAGGAHVSSPEWQNRPHDGLRDPLHPGRAFTPNEKYAALTEISWQQRMHALITSDPRAVIESCPQELFTAAGYAETVTTTARMIQSRKAGT